MSVQEGLGWEEEKVRPVERRAGEGGSEVSEGRGCWEGACWSLFLLSERFRRFWSEWGAFQAGSFQAAG